MYRVWYYNDFYFIDIAAPHGVAPNDEYRYSQGALRPGSDSDEGELTFDSRHPWGR